MTAFEVVSICMGIEKAHTVENDLKNNKPDIVVSWYHKPTGDICEIGGVGTLNWEIDDKTILSVAYGITTATEEQENELIKWSESRDDLY